MTTIAITTHRKFCDAATEGPWVASIQYGMKFILSNDNEILIRKDNMHETDREFIAASRTALPRALKALEYLLERTKPYPSMIKDLEKILEGK